MPRTLEQFIKNEDGNLLFMSAGMALPLLVLVGSAFEFSETNKLRNNIQTSADTAVIAAFRNPRESWTRRQRRVNGFFKANLTYRKRLKNLNTELNYHLEGKTTVMTFTVNGDMTSLFGELSPISSSSFTVRATAKFDPDSRRAPHLVKNTPILETKSQRTSRRRQ